MNRKLVAKQAASYALAGLILSMIVTFVALDRDAVRRESFAEEANTCSAVAVGVCLGHATSTIRRVQGMWMASAE